MCIFTCLKVNDLMAIFCSERRDSGTKRTMKKTSRRPTREAKITTDSSLPETRGQIYSLLHRGDSDYYKALFIKSFLSFNTFVTRKSNKSRG